MYEKEIEQLSEYLGRCRRDEKESLEIPMEKGLSDLLLKEGGRSLLWLLCRAGYEPKASIHYQSGNMKISNLVCCRDPYYSVTSQAEFRQALQEAGRQGQKKFRVMMPRTLLERLTGDGGTQQQALEKEAGVISCKSRIYPQYGLILYSAFSSQEKQVQQQPAAAGQNAINPGQSPAPRQVSPGVPPVLNDLQQVRKWVRKQAEALEDTIEFNCSKEVWAQLNEGVPDISGQPMGRLNDLTAASGIYRCDCRYATQSHTVRVILTVEQYYPGFHIYHTARLKQEAGLSPKEKRTLAAARQLLAGVREKDRAGLALAISRAIGQRTTYVIDDQSDDDDCAFGPLLNGEANCDGYADAFFLCASLAGFIVGYISGCRARIPIQRGTSSSARHMWNLIRIHDRWTCVDVTFDGNEKGKPLSSLYFMIGMDRAERVYRWNHEMFPTIQDTTDMKRAAGVYEFLCSSRREAVEVFREMKIKRIPAFVIFTACPGVLDNARDIFDYKKQANIYHDILCSYTPELNCWHILLAKQR